jgi:dTDP-4-amino-4,6-dideoxygalactose transaminase
MLRKTIAISLSPNTFRKDITLALKLLFSPWQWRRGKAIELLEEEFKNYFRVKYAVSFNSGRTAEFAILKAMGIKKGDEVLIQGFTCVVVPNPVIWLEARPAYVDFERESLNMDPNDLRKKVTLKSKAIIVQHTFGKPAKIDEIKRIAKKNNLFLIEDCAHSLGARFKGRKLGVYGEAAFFSFGRDKVISSVFGGMAITNNENIGEELERIQKELKFPSYFWIFQQLLHPIIFVFVLKFYNFFNLGKLILVGFQKLKLLSFSVTIAETETKQPPEFPTKLPHAQAALALLQFKRLSEFNRKREQISEVYKKKLRLKPVTHLTPVSGEIHMRYPVLAQKAHDLIDYAKKKGILLGDWYQNIVDPKGVDFAKAGYSLGSCPEGEEIAKKVINLPTYPKMTPEEVEKVVQLIKDFFQKENG